MADVAREAGVSVASVSNYLNKRPYMSEAMGERIARAIARLGYQVNSSARNLRSGRTKLLKLVIPDLRQMYFADLAEDILAEARRRGYGVIVESTSNSRDHELAAIASMGTRPADGLILSPLMMTRDDMGLLEGAYPLVMLGERLFGMDAPHVLIRNHEGAAAATSHLIESGRRRIAVIGAVRSEIAREGAASDLTAAHGRSSTDGTRAETSSGALRTRGYLAALADHGVPLDPELLVETRGWNSVDGFDAIGRMCDSGLGFDAVFALNDTLAWGALRCLRERGVDIPGEVRVVGFDDIDESSYMVPSLTTVDPGRADIARLAVESIVSQIEAGERAGAASIEAPCRLVFRESSPR
ncbi:LacI family DNA-binding transcriptional regulator [Bifidobacterium sp. MA2]|uniref:LacI family DNA-binding transcriptional regulator n=2 Tax=Bifidobacterium santillanense TaxID=2809028 RepID=A0ABS5UNB7_9BIFI|nr:LacI family DNA-binding transcriptional regulator [Bifidobacterium santillanense]